MSDDGGRLVVIDYVNYAGERSHRTIMPRRIEFGSNKWHPEPQWLLFAWDVDKQADRAFALRDVQQWFQPSSNE